MTSVALSHLSSTQGSCSFILHHLNYGCQRKLLRLNSLVERRSIFHAQTHPAKETSCDVIPCLKLPRGYIFPDMLYFLNKLKHTHTADP